MDVEEKAVLEIRVMMLSVIKDPAVTDHLTMRQICYVTKSEWVTTQNLMNK